MLVLTIATVDDSHVRHVAADLERGTARTVTHHHGVDAQRVDRRDGVTQRLTFLTLLDATANERTSALSRFAAVSKLSRVRVDSSKKSEATTRPLRRAPS